MKRTILCMAFGVMFGMSSSLVTAQPTPPAGAPAGAPAAPGGRGPGGGAPGAPGGPGGFGRGGGRGQQPLGPAAPVPPQVAMARPTTQEVSQINEALQTVLQSASTPAVLKKYQSLITVQVPRAVNPAATFTETGPRVGARHEEFVELAKKGDIELLLQGDSITDNWDSNPSNKQVMDKYFGKYKTANFGVGGDITQGVLWGMKNGEAQGFQPKAIMLMIGTNNTGSTSAGEIAEGVGAIVMEMRKDFPNAKILLLAIFPRGNPGDAVRQTIADCNKIIAKLDDQKNVFYMDIGPKFLDANGVITREIMADLLHPTAKGYEIWGEAVKDKLAELMK